MKNKCSNFAKLQPDLNGNPFLRKLKFYLNGNRLQKRLGVEGGKAAQIILSLREPQTDSINQNYLSIIILF